MKKYRILWGIGLLMNVSFAKWYGAFYMDFDTGIVGGSYNAGTEQEAIKVAKESCINKHLKKKIKNNCEPLEIFYNTCAAIYWSPINKKAGFGYSVFQNDAENAARRACKENSGKNCQLSLSICTDRIIY